MTSSLVVHKAKTSFLNSVIYVDKHIVVLNKPPGLVCQLNSREHESTGADGHFNDLLKALRHDLSLARVPYPVHRLDKGTTGSLALARTKAMARELSQQFQQRTVEKTYLALVRGGEKSFPSMGSQIRSPIEYVYGRATLGSQLRNSSITDWELLGSSQIAPLSLLRLKLHTGHKHQLRVHLAHCLKAPILGDTLYSVSPINEAITRISAIPTDRIYLHASEISFFRYKPAGRRIRVGVHAPLPSDFLELCDKFRLDVTPFEAKGGISVDGIAVENGEIPELNGYWAFDKAGVRRKVKYNYNKRGR